jgi:hypothetical protein
MDQHAVDFDLTYRPDYWHPSDPIAQIIANVKGEARRQMILDVLERRHLLTPPGAELPHEMLADTLSDQDRTAWGRFHPHFMGGEYLPDYSRGEMEIARIVLASTTMDVVSVRARRSQDLRIHYRIVDEYETVFVHHPRSSKAPLTLAHMISVLDSTRAKEDEPGHEFITWARECNYRRFRDDPKHIAHFVTVESPFYLQLEPYYRWRNNQWLARELAAIAVRGGADRKAGEAAITPPGEEVGR